MAYLASICAIFLPVPLVFAQAQFHWIPAPPGGSQAEVFSLSADGAAAVGSYLYPGGRRHSFRWTLDQGSIDIGGAIELVGDATGVSGGGIVVVGFGTFEGSLSSWRWTQETGLARLPGAPNGGLVIPTAASEDGLVIAGILFGGSTGAFRWTEGMGYQNIPAPDVNPIILAISGDGSTVVGTCGSGGPAAFLWRPNTGPIELPLVFPEWYVGFGTIRNAGLSYTGRYVAGVTGTTASRYDVSTDTLTLLAWPDGSPVTGRATGVTADGSIVVGDLASVGSFLWTEGLGARTISDVLRNDYGLTESIGSPRGISADGSVIVGTNSIAILREPAYYRGRPPCQGDVDGDQRVGLSDLLFVLGEWRRPEPDLGADITGDGIVDQLDLNIVLVDFGDDCARRRVQSAGPRP
ncbi:MAG: hypothetical protein AMXMBFR47_19480 [Planctomycetota bacterium]